MGLKILLVLLLSAALNTCCTGSDCYSPNGLPSRCVPLQQSFTLGQPPTTNSTCGNPPSEFCFRRVSLGQIVSDCTGICDASDPANSHPPSYMTDFILNEETSWQSENNVDVVQIDLSLRTMVEIDVISFDFLSLIPAAFYLERSIDYGQSYERYHYLSTSCISRYGINPDLDLSFENETTVLCQSIRAPPLPGLISFFPVIGRPSANDSTMGYSEALYNFITATNIRVILDGHFPLENLADDDQGYYYAIRDLNVVGSCQCHGHASACNLTGGEYQCQCEHNTAGTFCEECSEFYQDIPWQRTNEINQFECKPCNCNNHSRECFFDSDVYITSGMTSGGVCTNCTDNTTGRQCENCAELYYPRQDRVLTDSDRCAPCQCDLRGVVNNGDCVREATAGMEVGSCFCKENVEGVNCGMCKTGFFGLSGSDASGCRACECNTTGSTSNVCDQNGVCSCEENIVGDKCDSCLPGFYLVNANDTEGCRPCNCNPGGALSSECDLFTGQCICKTGIVGQTCSEAAPEYFFPTIDHIRLEAELSTGEPTPTTIIGNEDENSFFTGTGFSRVTDQTITLSIGSIVLPVGGEYEIIFRYNLEGILSWNSTVLTIIASSEEGQGPITCGSMPELPIGETTSLYSDWPMGIGLTTYRIFCLRGGRSYNFVLSNFNSGVPTGSPVLDIDSMVAILRQSMAVVELSDSILAVQYASCADSWRSLVDQPLACRDTTFTVSSAIYNGTLACECDPVGSTQPVCNAFGGQCSCAPGVRGRRCDVCRLGFYDISLFGCSSCDCNATGSTNTLTCDLDSGACPCRVNVVGRDCSACAQDHWNFNLGSGCVECQCNATGSESLQCSPDSGVCSCRDGVAGTLCNTCMERHYGFSEQGCRECLCSVSGSLGEDCTDVTGQCPCKVNVQGQDCSQCRDGTFDLQSTNPNGCQPCFCSGLTSECMHAEGFVASTLSTEFGSTSSDILSGWRLTTASLEGSITATVSGEGVYIIANTAGYLEAPAAFRGNHLSSYGQFFRVSVQFSEDIFQTSSIYDVILLGNGIEIGAIFSVAPSAQQRVTLSVQLSAENGLWTNVLSNQTVTPSGLQSVLSSLDRVLITTNFPFNLTLYSVELDVASFSGVAGDTSVTWVEQCVCPANYSGLSCESCAVGFTRSESGICELCQCNGLSVTCDAVTGACTNCSQLTSGEFCERCSEGTYGDPLNGIPCQACPCPFTDGVGQFSDECVLLGSNDVMCLNCPIGHTGLRCDSCINGFFGDPTGSGGTPTACSDCLCNGNINASDPNGCNRTNGTCLRCLFDTTGASCEQCLPGFFGDPIEAKNCTACGCDSDGSSDNLCDQSTGQCSCRPNVSGLKCDSCSPGHYNIQSGAGCLPCQCDPTGSESNMCDVQSGECSCRMGVAGPLCASCLEGYYGLSSSGCTACNCSLSNSLSGSCGDDGQCTCRSGAGGPNCQCLRNYFQTSDGCDACPQCYQELEAEVDGFNMDLQAAEERLTNLSSESLPFEARLRSSTAAVQSAIEEANNTTSNYSQLLNQVNQLTVLLEVTLRAQLSRINGSITVLKATSTPVFVLASTSEELMNRTLEELVQASAIIDNIATVLLPEITNLSLSISNVSAEVNVSTEDFLLMLALLSDQLMLLNNRTDEIEAIAMEVLITSVEVQELQDDIESVLPLLIQLVSEVSIATMTINSQLASLMSNITYTVMYIERIAENIPTLPSEEELSYILQSANRTLDYAMDLRNSTTFYNESLASIQSFAYTTQQLIQELLSNLNTFINNSTSIADSATNTYSNVQMTVNVVEATIQTARTILDNLTDFETYSSSVAAMADEALASVPTDMAVNTLSEAQDIVVVVQQLSSNVSFAKLLAQQVEETFQFVKEVITGANTEDLVQIVRTNVNTTAWLLDQAKSHLNNASSILNELENQSALISSLEQRIVNSSTMVNNTEGLSEEAVAIVDSLMRDIGSLPQSARDELEATRLYVSTVEVTVDSTRLPELVGSLRDEVERQRSERQSLQISVLSLQAEVERLKELASDLPDCN